MAYYRRIRNLLLTAATVLATYSCRVNEENKFSKVSSEIMTDVTVRLTSGEAGIKAEDPDEYMVSDISLMIFDENGGAEQCIRLTDGVMQTDVSLVKGRRYTFAACINFGYRVYADNIEELSEITHHLAYPDEYKEGMPMYSLSEDIFIEDNTVIDLEMIRLMAGICIKIDRSCLSPGVSLIASRVSIGNCPESVQVFRESRISGHDDCFINGFCRKDTECEPLNRIDRNGMSDSVTLYMFENMSGSVEGYDMAKETASYIELELDYLSDMHYSTSPPLKYRFFLGESKESLNVERNHMYTICVKPQDDGLKSDGWNIDKSGIRSFVKRIMLSESSLVMDYEGQEKLLGAELYPENASDRTLNWESSNHEVVSVSDDGTLKATGEGQCTIRCTSNDGSGAWASCHVECRFLPHRFKLYPANYIEGRIGDRIHIWCDVFPPSASFDPGYEELEFDRMRGIYEYEVDEDGYGVTITLTGKGTGIIYMSAGDPINQSEKAVIVVN